MNATSPIILTLNGGSSSIRFAVYRLGTLLESRLSGKLDRIGLTNPRLSFSHADGISQTLQSSDATNFSAAIAALLAWLDSQKILEGVAAVGHRIVHGMHHVGPALVNQELINELRQRVWLDPDHLPGEIELIEALRKRVPKLPQVACFDTTFHQHMPRVATLMAIPRRFFAKGVQRYGFHGLSYAYLMEELRRAAGEPVANGRVILAHLGNGASMAAVKDELSIDTSMGFTPASGLVMGTRSGDVDPGLGTYLERTEKMTDGQFDAMINHESGLLGVSETSSDMGDLLAIEKTDPRAAEAIALFCYQAKKQIGAYAAALGGIDTLVFAGGIGENAAIVRARICEGLAFLGIELDVAQNSADAAVISSVGSRVSVRVIRTNEELMIARSVCRALGYTSPTGEILP